MSAAFRSFNTIHLTDDLSDCDEDLSDFDVDDDVTELTPEMIDEFEKRELRAYATSIFHDFPLYLDFSYRKWKYGSPLGLAKPSKANKEVVAGMCAIIPPDLEFIGVDYEVFDDFIETHSDLIFAGDNMKRFLLGMTNKSFQLVHFNSVTDFTQNRYVPLGQRYIQNLTVMLANVLKTNDYPYVYKQLKLVEEEIKMIMRSNGFYPIKAKAHSFYPITRIMPYSDTFLTHIASNNGITLSPNMHPTFGLPIFPAYACMACRKVFSTSTLAETRVHVKACESFAQLVGYQYIKEQELQVYLHSSLNDILQTQNERRLKERSERDSFIEE